jgi:hypothetical protein
MRIRMSTKLSCHTRSLLEPGNYSCEPFTRLWDSGLLGYGTGMNRGEIRVVLYRTVRTYLPHLLPSESLISLSYTVLLR